MTNDTNQNLAWVTASASALNKQGSWTGRIHIHKLLYVVEELGCDSVPFNFRLYDYGPYSFDLDEEIINAQLRGMLIQTYPQPGYGPKYMPSPSSLALSDKLVEAERKTIDQVAQVFGGKGSQELERIATCIWIIKHDAIDDNELIINKAVELKPKYNPSEFQSSLDVAKSILSQSQEHS